MASIVRPVILRQTCLATASRRAFSTKVSSSFPAINKPVSVVLSKQDVRNTFFKNAQPSALKVASFHASSRRPILPPLPQVIEGTTNDAAKFPERNPAHGSYHWTFERLISAALIPLTIAPFAAGSLNPATDAILCATILIHSHIGFESCIVDYLPQKRVPKSFFVGWWGLRLATVVVGVGLYEFETNDVGVTEAIKRIWKA